jgi:hypothetical protein
VIRVLPLGRQHPDARSFSRVFSTELRVSGGLVLELRVTVSPSLGREVEDVPHRTEEVDAALVDVVVHPRM